MQCRPLYCQVFLTIIYLKQLFIRFYYEIGKMRYCIWLYFKNVYIRNLTINKLLTC